ncbi:MAG TPA: Rid family detoxifying hydrolase [Gaiella sp.]|jgi:reactive intermediate/imine deaminase
MTDRTPVSSTDAPPPGGAYSQAIRSGNLLFLSGQAGFDSSGARLGETVAEQTRQALENLDAVARAAGGSLQDAVRVGVYLSDLGSFAEMNEVYRVFFAEPYPARTTIQSDFLAFDVEIDAVVALGPDAAPPPHS